MMWAVFVLTLVFALLMGIVVTLGCYCHMCYYRGKHDFRMGHKYPFQVVDDSTPFVARLFWAPADYAERKGFESARMDK